MALFTTMIVHWEDAVLQEVEAIAFIETHANHFAKLTFSPCL